MQKPIISYNGKKLGIKFPGWTKAQVQAVQQMLICWTRKGENLLFSEPILLAYLEAIELIPQLQESEHMDTFHAEMTLKVARQPVIYTPGLKPVQLEPTALLAERDKALLTAAPGLGKTVMLCAAAGSVNPKVTVVVAPLSLLENWRVELEKWWLAEERTNPGIIKVETWRDSPKEVPDWEEPNKYVIITSPAVISKIHSQGRMSALFEQLEELDSLLILDESYLYKNRKSKRSLATASLSSFFKKCWQDSGMPISKFHDDLFFQLHILYPHVFRSYWKFVQRYCLVETNHWGSKIVGSKVHIEGLKKELSDILIECQYPDDIPDWEPEVVEVPMGGLQNKVYTQLKEELKVEASLLGWEKPLTIPNMLALTSRLLQAVNNISLVGDAEDCSCKEDKLLELLETKPLPALIWVNYIQTAKSLMEKLSKLGWIKPALLIGATAPAERQQVVEGFQTGKYNVLVLHPAVGKYGHTLTAARTAYYLQRTFDREGFYQTLFRSRRIVSTHSVNLVYLLATLEDGRPTLDHVVHKLLVDSSKNAQLLTAGELIGQL